MESSLSRSLEALPSEIKILIMCEMPDAESLFNILSASPKYYQTYLPSREGILHQITFRSLQKNNISVGDARAAISVPQFIPSAPYRKQDVLDFFDSYGRNVSSDQRRLAVDESRAILHMQRTECALVDGYCETMLTRNPYSGSPQELEKPSPSELHRLHRALWRWELFSRLSKSETHKVYHGHFDILGEDEMASAFFGLFPMHEVEELACLHVHACKRYREVFNRMTDGTLRKNNKYFVIDPIHMLISRGPSLLHCVLTASSPQDEADRCMNNAGNIIVSMKDVLDAYERVVNTAHWPWKGEDDPSNAERLHTLGWEWASWWSTCEIDFRLRKWGYVFWDDERLVNWGLTGKIIGNHLWSDDEDDS